MQIKLWSAPALLSTLLLSLQPFVQAQSKDVLTYHNDLGRTGQYTNETILTTANVNSTHFGKLWFLNADAHVDAEPLYAGGVLIPGIGYRNIVILVTENDSVYAYDADSTNIFWHAILLGAGETASDDRNCGQVAPIIGITGAPVIDRQLGPNGTMFVVAMSKTSSGAYFQRLYALDLATGTNRSSVVITGQYPGTGANSVGTNVIFDPAQYKERAGLLLLGGVIYTAWASHCDIDPYTGWIMGYDERTLAQTNIINVTPNASRGAIWMGNTALAVDSASNIVFLDANGIFDTNLTAQGFPNKGDYGNAFLKISTTNRILSIADYFETSNTVSQSSSDEDLGSGGAIVLPFMADANGVSRQLAVGAGKDKNIYIVDLSKMGKFNPGNNNAIYQEVTGSLGSSVFSMPAYFNGTLYYCANGDNLRAFSFKNARLGAMSSESASAAGATGATPSVSANGAANGIVWVIQASTSSQGILHAFLAANVAMELYNNTQAATNRDLFGGGNKYATPMIANGKVYVGATNGVAVFGLLNQSTPVPVAALAFVQQPSNTLAGAIISPEIQVQALDTNSQAVSNVQITLTLSAGSSPLGGTLIRTTDTNGIAHFNDLTLSEIGTNVLAATPSYGTTTSPTNSNPFVILSPTPPSQTIIGVTVNNDGSVTLTYATTVNYSYSIEATTNLAPGSWTIVPGSSTNAAGTSATFTDTTSVSSTERFYRITAK
jgi:hypothetical protein